MAATLAAAKPESTLVVAIDGVDAAGKTWFADELAAAMKPLRPTIRVSIDGFHHPASTRHAREASEPADSYYRDSFDYGAFVREVIEPIGPGGNRLIRPAVFDHVTDRPVDPDRIAVPNDGVVLVDGIFLGRPELDGCFDLWVYLVVSEEIAYERGVARDGTGSGDPAMRTRYRRRYLPGQAIYHREARPVERADILIDNDDLDAPSIVKMAEHLRR